MSPIVGKLLVWVGDQAACIRIVGRANFALSVDFRKLLRHLLPDGSRRLLLDLSECQTMDSTFLGVLAFEASQGRTAGTTHSGAPMKLLNAKPAVREIIEDLGIARLFEFEERDFGQQQFDAVPAAGAASAGELTRTSLEAHELLMALHPANVAKFKEVARFLTEEFKSSADPGAAPGN